MVRPFVAIAALGALGLAAPAHTSSISGSLTLGVSRQTVVFGQTMRVYGRAMPARAAAPVALELDGRVIARTATDAAGRFTALLALARGGALRARTAGGAVRSLPVAVVVRPRLHAHVAPVVPFGDTTVSVTVHPAALDGPTTVTVLRNGRAIASAEGRDRIPLTAPAPGAYVLRVELGGSRIALPLRVAARALSIGSKGARVRALATRLTQLRIHVPAETSTYGSELADAVIAFQKSRGLDRTGAVDDHVWRALAVDRSARARYALPRQHIEIDKTRQILLDVENGEVVGVLPVSTGATGNTAVGTWSILWKAPSTSTWLGSAILYRTMTFHRGFAIHGFPSVPAYPASHGCVRIPIWTADWLYERSPVGERVYVYG